MSSLIRSIKLSGQFHIVSGKNKKEKSLFSLIVFSNRKPGGRKLCQVFKMEPEVPESMDLTALCDSPESVNAYFRLSPPPHSKYALASGKRNLYIQIMVTTLSRYISGCS